MATDLLNKEERLMAEAGKQERFAELCKKVTPLMQEIQRMVVEANLSNDKYTSISISPESGYVNLKTGGEWEMTKYADREYIRTTYSKEVPV